MSWSIEEISILQNQYMIELIVHVPESTASNYQYLFNTITIPIYHFNQDDYKELGGLQDKTFAVLTEINNALIMAHCQVRLNIHVCSSHPETDV